MVLARWQATIADEAGNVLPHAQIEVRREVAGAPLANLFTDRDGAAPLGNPFNADAAGLAAFHVAGGPHRITATSGDTSIAWRYVAIGTAAEFDAAAIAALVQNVDSGYALAFESQIIAPPSPGAIRFNSANLAAATQAFVSVQNLAGSDIQARLLELFNTSHRVKDTIILTDPAGNAQASFRVDNAVAVGGTHVALTVAAQAGATSFPAGTRINLQRERAGADGADGAVAGTRQLLTSSRTYFVRTDGSDANNGLVDSAAGAFLTVQKAIDTVFNTLDLAGFDVTVQLRTGTFGRAIVSAPQVGKGAITLQGDSVTPSNVVLAATAIGSFSAGAVDVRNNAQLTVKDLTLQVTTSGSGLFAQNGGIINFTNLQFAACADAHIHAVDSSQILATGNYAISGGAQWHWLSDHGSQINAAAKTLTLTGTPAFSQAFAGAFWSAYIKASGNTYAGTATGKRFVINDNATIEDAGGATALPGNAAGTIAEGGRHPALNYEASNADIYSAAPSAEKYITAERLESASAFQFLADGATIALDWDAGINRFVTLAGNRTLSAPFNNQIGTWRTIWVVGDSATPRTLAFGANWLGNTATITGITSTARYLISVLALDATFVWVAPPQGPF